MVVGPADSGKTALLRMWYAYRDETRFTGLYRGAVRFEGSGTENALCSEIVRPARGDRAASHVVRFHISQDIVYR